MESAMIVWVKSDAVGMPNDQLCEIIAHDEMMIIVRMRGTLEFKRISPDDIIGVWGMANATEPGDYR